MVTIQTRCGETQAQATSKGMGNVFDEIETQLAFGPLRK